MEQDLIETKTTTRHSLPQRAARWWVMKVYGEGLNYMRKDRIRGAAELARDTISRLESVPIVWLARDNIHQ